jgi:hypothetical protein
MLALLAALVSSTGHSARAETMKLGKDCQWLYQKWQGLGGSKAFFATTDGVHCGYSFGRPNISYAITFAMRSCNKYGKGEKCLRLQ